MNRLKLAIICFLFLDCSVAWSENNQEFTRVSINAKVSTNAAVLAAVQHLMSESKLALNKGKLSLANSTIERGIRLDRNNPWLWHNLAVIRVRQNQYAKAIQIALKSNDLSHRFDFSRVKKLQLNNWKLIHFCHLQLGEPKKVKKALKFVEKLSN